MRPVGRTSKSHPVAFVVLAQGLSIARLVAKAQFDKLPAQIELLTASCCAAARDPAG